MSLESLIAERDRIAEQLRDANQRICDEFNRLYPVWTQILCFDKRAKVLSAAYLDMDDGSPRFGVLIYGDTINPSYTESPNVERMQPIPQEAKT